MATSTPELADRAPDDSSLRARLAAAGSWDELVALADEATQQMTRSDTHRAIGGVTASPRELERLIEKISDLRALRETAIDV